MITGNSSPLTSKWLSRSLLGAVLSTMGLLSGFNPSISLKYSSNLINFNVAASAQNSTPQNLTAEQLTSYASSLLVIEPLRQEYYNQIKQQLQQLTPGEPVPQISCSDPNSLNNLPREIRGTAAEYCQESIGIVESNNLTIEQFNQITESLQSDPVLLNRITQDLIRLQGNDLFK